MYVCERENACNRHRIDVKVSSVFSPSHPHTVTGLTRETEAIKMMSVRAGLLDLSQSWATLGRKCTVLAESQRVRVGGREGGEIFI